MHRLIGGVRFKFDNYFIRNKQVRSVVTDNNTFKLNFDQKLQFNLYAT